MSDESNLTTETLDSLRAERDSWRRGTMLVLDELAGYDVDKAPHIRVRHLRASFEGVNQELGDFEEREAAACPEDYGFEEYIDVLKAALRPFARVHQEGLDRNEAVLCRNNAWILNKDIERAYRLVGEEKELLAKDELVREAREINETLPDLEPEVNPLKRWLS